MIEDVMLHKLRKTDAAWLKLPQPYVKLTMRRWTELSGGGINIIIV